MKRNTPFYIVASALTLAFLAMPFNSVAAVNIPWVLNGNAQRGQGGRIVLTPDAATQRGTMWNPCTVDINNNFDMTFNMNFGSRNCGGDGIAFILQNNGTGALGLDSGEHGYSNGGISQSLAITFDTYINPAAPYNDPPYDSLGVELGGTNTEQTGASCPSAGSAAGTGVVTGTCGRPAISQTLGNIKDGLDHVVRMQWNGATKTITITVDGNVRAVWTFPASLVATYFAGNSNVYYGFGASTGGATNYHQVEQVSGNPACAVATPMITATSVPLVVNTCNTIGPTFTPPGPTNTPTITPTPYPTVCGATPAFVQSLVVNGVGQPLANGCLGSGSPTSWPYTVPAGPGQILIVNIETSGSLAGSVTYNGVAMSPLPSNSAVAITGGGNLYSYYMVNPPNGTFTLAVPGSGCSWNIAATVYKNVNTASPFGAISTNGGSNATFNDTITTTTGYSIIHDFFAYPSGPQTFGGTHGTQLFAANTSQCCDDVFGSYTGTTAPGAYSNTYTDPGGTTNWTGVSVELKPVTACNTPTFTLTLTRTPTRTLTVTPTITVTDTVVITPTFTVTLTSTRTFTPTLTSTLTATPTITLTRTPTVTYTETLTATRTPTPTPTFTVTFTPTFTLTMTPTLTRTPTPSVTITVSQTFTSTITRTPTPSVTYTVTSSPTSTFTLTATPTVSLTRTPTPSVTITVSMTATLTATRTPTPTSSFTATSTVTFTATPTSTYTVTATQTFTATRTSTLTQTPTFTDTKTVTPGSTPTYTVTFTNTATSTYSSSVTSTLTSTPSRTATPSSTYTSTSTLTSSMTSSATPTPTFTFTLTSTRTATPTMTFTPTVTLTETRTFTNTKTVTPGSTPTYTVTFTYTATSTFSRTSTSTFTMTPTSTVTVTSTLTSTPTMSVTPTATLTQTQTFTNSKTVTPGSTPTFTVTPTFTLTATSTRTPTPTNTVSVTSTLTATATLTATSTVTLTETQTFTNTKTVTPGSTPTWTVTPTFTLTSTPSRSSTPSFTVSPSSTVTSTSTFTNTLTSTPTQTQTFTNSKTVTPGSTPTWTITPTSTPSFTSTYSRTSTSTFTATPTWTITSMNTSTNTPTSTPSYTITPTITLTSTRTSSPTLSSTPSFTSTLTATPTWTITTLDTSTSTPTDSPTRTVTVTFSSTYSSTPTWTLTSVNTATSTPTVTSTYTATPTFTATRTSSPTQTNSPVNTATFTSTITSSSTVTFTYSFSATRSATPTATRTVTSSATYTSSPTATYSRTSTPSSTSTPSITVTPTSTHSPTESPTPIPMPMQLKVSIYNSAGEKVKTLYDGKAQSMPGAFTMDGAAVIPGSGAGVNLSFGGMLATGAKNLTWFGDNDNGQAVSGGTYYFKTETVDAFGAAQSWTQAIAVLPQAELQTLNIYNSAGELVKTLNTSSMTGTTMTKLGFRDPSKNAFALGVNGGVEFVLEDAGGNQITKMWDGKSNSGNIVASGSYTVQLVDNSIGHTVLVSKGFVLLADPTQSPFDAVIGPNPVGAKDTQVIVGLSGEGAGNIATVRIYNLAGELIAQGVEAAGSGKIVLQLGNWSAGIYVAVVESHDGPAIVSRKLRRLAIQR